MDVEREELIEFGVPVAATLVFIVAVAVVGALFGADGLSETGALVLVGVIVAFILGVALLGFATGSED